MSENENKNIQSDYDYSRQTYYDLIEKGRESLEDMIDVDRQSENTRANEFLSGMIKNISDVNDKLMDLNKKQKDINKKDDEPKQIGNTTNNVFLGSTSDLQRLLQQDENIINVTPDGELSRES